jgi:TPP-dependent indolepyruvate ferredoxin oxidoreductase alpha subunit
MALRQWYSQVRLQFISNEFPEPLFDALKEKLFWGMNERIGRLKALSQKMPDAVIAFQNAANKNGSEVIAKQKHEFHEKWTELEEIFNSHTEITTVKEEVKDSFLDKIRIGIIDTGKDYISVIQNIKKEDKEQGTQWLQGIVDHIVANALKIIPTFKK